MPVLSRSSRGSTLTPSGQVVVDWAAALLAAADGFTQSVSALAAQKSVTVRAAVSMTIAEHHAPVWVARLARTAPETVVSLMVHNSTDVAQLVESGAADVGFIESPTVRRSLRRRRLAWDHLVVAVPPGHEWAGERRINAAELGAARPLVREPGSGTRETLEAALARKGIELSTGLVMGSNAALKTAALAGMGPVVLSESTLGGQLSSGQLIRVDVDDLDLRRPLSVVWRRDEALPDGVLALLKVATDTG
jgi:DNA-binding transcriptional LysR family regulator